MLTALERGTAIVAVRVLWRGREPDETLDMLSPLWEWLFANRTGILQADDEGWYHGPDLILEPRPCERGSRVLR